MAETVADLSKIMSERLSKIVGIEHVLDWASALTSVQASSAQPVTPAVMAAIAGEQSPSVIASPGTVTELSQIIALAAENSWRVLPMGQGSKLGWGGLAPGIDLVVSTARLNRVVDHAVGDFTVTVEPGLKVIDLQRQLAEQGQFLAVDPAFGDRATIGGLVATADTGSLRQRYGGLRDMLIGVQFVRHDGELARAGGRVVKNVAGYDLMKLLTGAYGSLGILSELTFRLYPIQTVSRTLVLLGNSLAIEAATAEVRLSGLTPVALDVLSASLTSATLSQRVRDGVESKEQQETEKQNQADNTASEGLPKAERSRSLVARFQGIAAGVEEQTERLKKIATTHSMTCEQLDGGADEAFWQRSAEMIQPNTVLCKVGLRPSGIPWLIELADDVMPGAQVRLYGSSGLGWIQFESGGGAKADTDKVVSGLEKLRSHCQQNAGFLTVLQAPKAVKHTFEVWGYSGNALGVMRDLKEKFDPDNILSPGRFVGGL